METVVSLIPNDEHVATARQELETAGVAEGKISEPVDVWQRLGGWQPSGRNSGANCGAK